MKQTAKILCIVLMAVLLCVGLIACAHKKAEDHTATGELGSLRMVIITKIEIMIGIISGVCNCCASCTESTLEPIAAKIAE